MRAMRVRRAAAGIGLVGGQLDQRHADRAPYRNPPGADGHRDPPDRRRHRPDYPDRHPRRSPRPARLHLRFATSELTALALNDLQDKPPGLLTVYQSQTDHEGHGQVVGVAPRQPTPDRSRRCLGPPAVPCVARRLGALFTCICGNRVSLEPLAGNAVGQPVAKRGLRTVRAYVSSLITCESGA
jgi:hypothetical protein